MKQVRVRIRGISPLLMHRFPLEPVEALVWRGLVWSGMVWRGKAR
jgi:hypothetical protein